ncbi:MAG: universal stress protein [Stappiaceae bacterium]
MFKTILVPIDPAEPEFANPALEKAIRMSHDYGARLHLVAVRAYVQGYVTEFLPADYDEKAVEEASEQLAGIASRLEVPEGKLTSNVRSGAVYTEVMEEAEAIKADLIMLNSHRPGVATYFLGSNAANIVRHARCSVLVLREEGDL